ncbi:MAG TPA: hypothetical protein DD725_07685 [Deltaproteobacteria bacterium]|nr:hypothetical protein [Deltaproteobacteria bacterium]
MLGVEFINMDRWLNIGVLGGACWPTNELKITIGGHELILKPATKDTEQSIHINLKGISDIEAMTLINRFLSILAWCDDQGIENFGGGSGNPIPVTVPRKSRVVGSSIAFPFNRDIEKNTKAQLSLALYREGLTINSIPFAFLSYFKILNIFWKDKYTNGVNELIEGIRGILPCIKEGLAEKRIVEVKKTENDVPKYLYESGRCAIAHAHSNPIVDPDDVTDLRRLSQDVWIVKAMAEYLIETKLNVSRTILG